MKLATRRQLARLSLPEPPLGEALWRQTNEIRMSSPVLGVAGRLRDTVYVMRGGKTFVRRYVAPVCPNTARQLDGQERFRFIQRSWSGLPEEVRRAWCSFARQHVLKDRADDTSSGPGQNAFARAQTYRLGWGGALLTEAPTYLPPPAARFIEEVAAPDAGQLAFRIGHDLKKIEGYRVLFEITPATPTLKRAPEERRFSWAGETSADSFLPLGADRDVYLLERPRFSIDPGRRYGVRVRLLTPDGLPGPVLSADLIRKEPEVVPAPSSFPDLAGSRARSVRGDAQTFQSVWKPEPYPGSESSVHGARGGMRWLESLRHFCPRLSVSQVKSAECGEADLFPHPTGFSARFPSSGSPPPAS